MALRLLVLGELGGVGRGLVLIDIDLADGGTGLGDLDNRRLLEVGGALDGLHEVRDQVGAALVDILHLGPRGVDCLRAADQTVIAADGGKDDEEDDTENDEERFIHDGWVLVVGR